MYDKNFRKHFNFANYLTRKVREIKMHALYSNMKPTDGARPYSFLFVTE